MNLAIVSPYPPDITGIGQYGFHVSRALAQSGQFENINVLAGARAENGKVSAPSSLTVIPTWKPDDLGIGPKILSSLQQRSPDLVWFNVGASVFGRSPLANLLAFLFLYQVRASGLPTVITLHELVELSDLRTLNAPGGRLALLGARFFSRIATNADVVCLTMRRYVHWFSARRPDRPCIHIPIGAYQLPEFLPESKSPELLFFGSIAPYKGLEVLLSAYRILLARYPNLRITVAGADHPRFPEYRRKLQSKFRAIPGARWMGPVPEDQVRQIFSRAQIVVLPHLASTGSSSVLYQAAMWGRSVVASDLPETRSAAAESDLQVAFYQPREPASLACAIQQLLDTPSRRHALAEHNFHAIQSRRPEVTCRLYLKAFNLALEAHRSPKQIEIPIRFPSELA